MTRSSASEGKCWRVTEIDLVSSQGYDNPYRDVEVTVTFTGPGEQTITRPAFWFASNTWKVRFAPTKVGKWFWKASCSNPKDEGLHARTGELACQPYEGDLPIYKHGFLHASNNKRFFTYADGTPFFWLGDTHWMGPDRETVKECNHPEHNGARCPHGGQFQHLMQDRKTKGFTVYQIFPSPADDCRWRQVERTSDYWWTRKYDRIDPSRFRAEFDVMMDYLADHGFVVAMGLGHMSAPRAVGEADLKRWARYIVARYGAHPVVWITSQESDMHSDTAEAWRSVAIEIHRVDGYGHPLSYHQRWGPKTTWWNESWHDWGCTQGGHRIARLRSKKDYREFWNYTPHKPWLESEHNYEGMSACEGPHTDTDVRHAAWKSMLCGSLGYTYGSSGVWLLGRDTEDVKCNPWIDHVWFDGMNLPASAQMTHLKDLYTNLEWWKLEPRWNDPKWGTWSSLEEVVISTDGNRRYVVYFYDRTKDTGTLKNMEPGKPYEASWFNPRKGEHIRINGVMGSEKGQWNIPEKPDTQDWVLLVQVK